MTLRKYDSPRSRLGRVGELGMALEVEVCNVAVAGTAEPNMSSGQRFDVTIAVSVAQG